MQNNYLHQTKTCYPVEAEQINQCIYRRMVLGIYKERKGAVLVDKVTADLQMKTGLNLHMAAKIADTAARCNVRGTLCKENQYYNVGSVLQMASSGINAQDEITVCCTGLRAQEALDTVVNILQSEEN